MKTYMIVSKDGTITMTIADGFYLDTENVVFYTYKFLWIKELKAVFWKPLTVFPSE